jgi:hypothetical protein
MAGDIGLDRMNQLIRHPREILVQQARPVSRASR